MKISLLLLTCANDKEAQKISRVLLEKRLVVCTKRLPISSIFLWQKKIDQSKEVLVLIETADEKFEAIEKEIKKISSYETFVLLSIPVTKTTKAVQNWLKTELCSS